MINPLDNKGRFKHELKFYDFNMDWYEVCEPIGFIGSKFTLKQDKGLARDTVYFAINGVEFHRKTGRKLETPRAINPQGDLDDHLDYGLDWLLENRKLNGSEMKVGYRISVNDVVFREFELDTRDDRLTDGKDWFKCKLIEIGEVADHKRNEKNTFNAFSDKNWRDEPIAPIDSFNYLVKAQPLVNESLFKLSGDWYYENHEPLTDVTIYNPSQVIEKSEINDTLGWLDVSKMNPDIDDFLTFGIIQAVVDTSDITIDFDVDFDYNFFINSDSRYTRLCVTVDGISTVYPLTVFPSVDGVRGTITKKFSIHIDNLPVGVKILCFYQTFGFFTTYFRKNTISIRATEKELDLVISAVLYTDLIKQSAKFVNNLPVLFQMGGRLDNQVVFNRNALRNKKELYATPELVLSELNAYCADAEYNQHGIDVRHRSGYYENYEIGAYLIDTSEDYSESYDEEYLINNFQFGFKDFEQDKTIKNTAGAIHTQAEFLPRNERREASKKIELDFVRDPLYRQTVFNTEIRNPSTSTDRDEKLFIEERIRIPSGLYNEFSRTLLMRWADGRLEILNRNTLGTNDSFILNWSLIGLSVGTTLQILSGANSGSYIVYDIRENGSILVLTPTTTIIQQTGNDTIKIKFFYSGVLWQTRTTDGFSLFTESLANLTRTIKRSILSDWTDYLATALLYARKDIKVSFFKNLPSDETFVTQLTSETVPVSENAPILYSDLPEPIIEPVLIKTTIETPYFDVVDTYNQYKTKKGFIRLYDGSGNVVRVFSKDFGYELSASKSDITGQKKYESKFLKIDTVTDGILVNDAPYDLHGFADWFVTENDYIKLYDKKSRPLSNFYKYDFVILNGQSFSSINALVTALNQFSWT